MPKNDLLLRNVPIDVRKIILREQAKEKDKRNVMQYSITSTVIKIIRQWENKCREV